MTTYAFPAVTPTDTVFEIVSNTKTYRSPFTGTVQTVDRGGEYLVARLSFRNLKGADKALMVAWLAKLNGQQHRFTLHNHAEENRGSFGGTPLVQGGSQTGTSLIVDGCSNDITNWIRAGDFFGVDSDVKICTADASSNGSGAITIPFSPRLRESPANNAAITTSSATGVFMLADPTTSWKNKPGGFCDFAFTAVEDVAA